MQTQTHTHTLTQTHTHNHTPHTKTYTQQTDMSRPTHINCKYNATDQKHSMLSFTASI